MGDSLHADDALLFAAYQRVIMGSMNVPDIPVNSRIKLNLRVKIRRHRIAHRDAMHLILTGEAFAPDCHNAPVRPKARLSGKNPVPEIQLHAMLQRLRLRQRIFFPVHRDIRIQYIRGIQWLTPAGAHLVINSRQVDRRHLLFSIFLLGSANPQVTVSAEHTVAHPGYLLFAKFIFLNYPVHLIPPLLSSRNPGFPRSAPLFLSAPFPRRSSAPALFHAPPKDVSAPCPHGYSRYRLYSGA